MQDCRIIFSLSLNFKNAKILYGIGVYFVPWELMCGLGIQLYGAINGNNFAEGSGLLSECLLYDGMTNYNFLFVDSPVNIFYMISEICFEIHKDFEQFLI